MMVNARYGVVNIVDDKSLMRTLRIALAMNAASCLVFGMLMSLWPRPVADFIGTASPSALAILGAGLLINGVHLAWAAHKQSIRALEVWYFIVLDLLWITLTLTLIAARAISTSMPGIAVVLGVTVWVTVLALVQSACVGSMDVDRIPASQSLPRDLPVLSSVGRSWLSIKPWVKVWLFTLNAVFVLALWSLPQDMALITLCAYLGSGPWLMALALGQRGLTRLLGLAHLVHWTPLAAYLVTRLSADSPLGPRLRLTEQPTVTMYAIVLLTTTCVCLALDLYDLWRWHRGQRFRLGSPAAVEVSASMPAARPGGRLAPATTRQPQST